MNWLLVVVDDLSLTTLLHPCESCTAEVFIHTFINEWLAHYPEPIMLHTDGGTHFDNEVVRGITQACGLQHNISTAYAKWANGLVERTNRHVLDIIRPLLRSLGHDVNKWPKIIKLVQRALQRKRRPSRGNMSPIQSTMGTKPRDAVALLVNEGLDIRQIDGEVSGQLDRTVDELAQLLEAHWDLADTARRAKSDVNRRRNDMSALPEIALGDYVLYAQYVRDTKLDYKWRGPAQVIHRVNPLIYIVDPVGAHHVQPFAVHVSLLRRFAAASLNITEQLRIEIQLDHPDNIVQKLVAHKPHDGGLWYKVRWLGFTAERDTWQTASELLTSCPDKLLEYYRSPKTTRTPPLIQFMRAAFPSAEEEDNRPQPARHFRRRRTARAKNIPIITTPANAQPPRPARRRGRPRTVNFPHRTTGRGRGRGATRGRGRGRGRGRKAGVRGRGSGQADKRTESARTSRDSETRMAEMSTTEYAAVVSSPLPSVNGQPRHVKVSQSGTLVTTADNGDLVALPTRSQQQSVERATRARRRQQQRSNSDMAAELRRTKQELADASIATATAASLQAQTTQLRKPRYDLRTRTSNQYKATSTCQIDYQGPHPLAMISTADLDTRLDNSASDTDEDIFEGMQMLAPHDNEDGPVCTAVSVVAGTHISVTPAHNEDSSVGRAISVVANEHADMFANMQIVPYNRGQQTL